MKFGANTFIWASPFGNEHLDLIHKVRQLGFDVFEIAYDIPERLNLKRLKDALTEQNLEPSLCGVLSPDRDLSSDDPDVRAHAADYIRSCIDAAHEIGAKVVGGPLYAAVGVTRDVSPLEREAVRSRCADELRPLAHYAGEHGIRLALELINRFETDILNTVEQGLAMVAEIDSPHIGLHLDTFHMNLEEKNSAEAIRRTADKLFLFHISENDRGIPGTGQVHWQEIATALNDVRYKGHVVIEAFTPEVKSIARAVSLWRPLAPDQDTLAREGLAFLKTLFPIQGAGDA